MIRALAALIAVTAVAVVAVGTTGDPSIGQLVAAAVVGALVLLLASVLDRPGRLVVTARRLRREVVVGAGLAIVAACGATTQVDGTAAVAVGLAAVGGLIAVVATVGASRR